MTTMRVISLGAGVQSTTLVYMALAGEFDPAPDCAIFADTQWEPEAVYRNLVAIEKAAGDRLPIHRVTAGDLRGDVLRSVDSPEYTRAFMPLHVLNREGDGKYVPGTLWRKCTREYKLDPVKRKIRELLGVEKGRRVPKGTLVEQWLGITTDEAHRMKPSRDPWLVTKFPLVDLRMSRNDCISWMVDRGHPIPPKSACLGCPYHANAYWAEMKKKTPEEFADVVEFDEGIRKGKLPGVTGDAYVHRKCRPLDDVAAGYGEGDQGDLFGEECEGLCGL